MLDSFEGVKADENRRYDEFRSKRLVLAAFDALDPPGVPLRMGRQVIPGIDPTTAPADSGRPGSNAANAGEAGRGTPPAEPTPATEAQSALPLAFVPSEPTGWLRESDIRPAALVLGMRVRHQLKGEGTLLTVRLTRGGGELLIRFDVGGEVWMLFGLSLLEFAVDAAGGDGPP